MRVIKIQKKNVHTHREQYIIRSLILKLPILGTLTQWEKDPFNTKRLVFCCKHRKDCTIHLFCNSLSKLLQLKLSCGFLFIFLFCLQTGWARYCSGKKDNLETYAGLNRPLLIFMWRIQGKSSKFKPRYWLSDAGHGFKYRPSKPRCAAILMGKLPVSSFLPTNARRATLRRRSSVLINAKLQLLKYCSFHPVLLTLYYYAGIEKAFVRLCTTAAQWKRQFALSHHHISPVHFSLHRVHHVPWQKLLLSSFSLQTEILAAVSQPGQLFHHKHGAT